MFKFQNFISKHLIVFNFIILILFSCSKKSEINKATDNQSTTVNKKSDLENNYFSEHLNIKTYTVKDGLPEISAYSLLEDSLGYIWATTQNGAVKFDGNNFKTYNHKVNDTNSIMSNATQGIFEINKKEIIISHLDGISIYNRYSDNFTNYSIKILIPSIQNINGQKIFFKDSMQNVWMSFSTYNVEKQEDYLIKFNLNSRSFNLIDKEFIPNTCVLSNNKKSIAYFNSKNLNIIDCHTKKSRKINVKIPSDSIYYFMENNDSTYLLSTENHIYCINKTNNDLINLSVPNINVKEIKLFNANDKLFAIIWSTDSISSLFEIKNNKLNKILENKMYLSFINSVDNELWIQGNNFKNSKINLIRYFKDTRNVKSYNTDINTYFQTTLIKTKQNTFWIGGFRTGLSKFSFEDNQYRKIKFNPLLEDISYYPLAYKDSLLFIISSNCHLWKYNMFKNSIDEIPLDLEKKEKEIYSFNTFENEVFIGTDAGLYIFDLSSQKTKKLYNSKIPREAQDKPIYSCFKDKKNRLWLANGLEGVLMLFPENEKIKNNYQNYDILEFNLLKNASCGLNDNRIMDIIENKNGTIFLSNQVFSGLSKFDDKTKKFLKIDLNNNSIFGGFNQFSPLKNKMVFISSYTKGIASINLNSESLISYYNTSQNNLSVDWIEDIHFLTDSTFLFRGDDSNWKFYNVNQKEERLFSELGDFQRRELFKYSQVNLNDTIEFLPGVKCFYLLNKKYEPNLEKSKIDIGSLLIDNEPIFPETRPDLLKEPIEETKTITLPYKLNSFSVSFYDNMDYNPDQVNYEYILEGYNKNWIKSVSKNIDFINVQEGNYNLKIRASTFNNKKKSKEYVINIIINPPLWRTWWAYTIYVLMILSLFITFIKWRIRILKNRQIELELKIDEATYEIREQKHEVESQKHLVEEKQKEILDSIHYAKRLQEAILPPLKFIDEHVPNNFVLYQPKDVVAGDFYWAETKDNKFFIAAADSTGHGVPGAMVSVVCSNALNRTVNEFGITDTGKILDKTRELVLETFAKGNAEVKDGMDISLLCIDKQINKAFWSGANNPLWYVSYPVTSSEVEKSIDAGLEVPVKTVTSSEVEKSTDSGLDSARPDIQLTEIKADKQPIGKSDYAKPFTTHEIALQEGMLFYLFTDGFADQFGGPKGKKFKHKQLEELLLANANKNMSDQHETLSQQFALWKGDLEQVDDVCVIGVKF